MMVHRVNSNKNFSGSSSKKICTAVNNISYMAAVVGSRHHKLFWNETRI